MVPLGLTPAIGTSYDQSRSDGMTLAHFGAKDSTFDLHGGLLREQASP